MNIKIVSALPARYQGGRQSIAYISAVAERIEARGDSSGASPQYAIEVAARRLSVTSSIFCVTTFTRQMGSPDRSAIGRTRDLTHTAVINTPNPFRHSAGTRQEP